MSAPANHATISRNVPTTGGVTVSAYTVHLDDDQMQVCLATRSGSYGCLVSSYLTVDQARQLSAALAECADQYEAVRRVEGGAA